MILQVYEHEVKVHQPVLGLVDVVPEIVIVVVVVVPQLQTVGVVFG